MGIDSFKRKNRLLYTTQITHLTKNREKKLGKNLEKTM